MSFERVADKRDIVAIGASAGGVTALLALCAALPENFPAAVLVVLHVGRNSSVLPMLLSTHGHNPAVHAEDGQRIERGTVYIAPPDQHMQVETGVIRLCRGPKEHHTRPAVDPLFRSAAVAYGPRVVGVVLTGRLDDGTAGLRAIKDCGGVAVIQDPAEAEHPSMPRSALQSVAVDHCVPLASMAGTLLQLVTEPLPAAAAALPKARDRASHELSITAGAEDAMEQLKDIAKPSTFSCPDCQGVLWEIDDVPSRYRCHTGHAYSLRSLEEAQAQATENALWAAMRALQVREELLRRISAQNRAVDAEAEAAAHEKRAEQAATQAHLLHRMLTER